MLDTYFLENHVSGDTQMRKKWKRYLIFPILLLAALCLGTGDKPGPQSAGPGQDDKGPPMMMGPMKSKVAVGRVGESVEIETRRYTGHVVSSSSVSLVPRVSGEVLGVLFKEGQFVHKEDLLYELDPVRYDAALKNAQAKVAEYKAKLAYTEASFERASNLYRESAASKDNMESAQSEHEATEAMLHAAQADVITARDDLANTLVHAPISGKISVTNFTAGNYVTPSSGILATIVQTDPLRVTFSLSNRDFLSMFRTEQVLKEKASIRLRLADDSEYEYHGVVELIDNQANRQTDTIQVYASFENPDGILIPESTVTVLLSRTNGDLAPAVPPSAVMHDARSAYVYVLTDADVVERRDVALGVNDGQVQIVKAGLTPGERIVVDGMHKTMPGGVVIPVEQGDASLASR